MKRGFSLIQTTSNFLLLIGSVLCLVYPAIINGFPLVYSDSGTYIANGFNNTVPVDRPIMYAFFVRHISLYESLWLVIIMQALIIVSLSLIIFKYLIRKPNSSFYSFLTIAFLSLTTGVSNYTSQIMPDIFSAVAILGLSLLLILPNLSNYIKAWLMVLLILANMGHSSNLLTTTTITLIVITFYKYFNKTLNVKRNQLTVLSVVILFSWLATPTLNYFLNAGFKVSRAPNVFIMARLTQSGILNDYLKEKCPSKESNLCKYIDNLPPSSPEFLWLHSSPIYDGGCFADGHMDNCWLLKNEEYQPIIHDILTTPKYLIRFISFSVSQTLKQIVDFKTGGLDPMMEGSPVLVNVQWRFKRDYPAYISSQQSKQTFIAENTNITLPFVVILSLLLLILILSIERIRITLSKEIKCLITILFLGLIFNALVCSTFSMVVGRFQGRIIWLLPFIALVILFNRLQKRNESNSASS